MFGPGEHDDLGVIAVEHGVVGHEATVAEAALHHGMAPVVNHDALAVVDLRPDVAVSRRRLRQRRVRVDLGGDAGERAQARPRSLQLSADLLKQRASSSPMVSRAPRMRSSSSFSRGVEKRSALTSVCLRW